jgi:hypothetical protein
VKLVGRKKRSKEKKERREKEERNGGKGPGAKGTGERDRYHRPAMAGGSTSSIVLGTAEWEGLAVTFQGIGALIGTEAGGTTPARPEYRSATAGDTGLPSRTAAPPLPRHIGAAVGSRSRGD